MLWSVARIVSEIRRLHRKREPLNISAVKRNHPELLKAAFEVKPFLGWLGAIRKAGLEYADLNVELLDTCRCEICGSEAGGIVSHLRILHEITTDEYRKDYPEAPFESEWHRSRRMTSKKTVIPHWEPIWSVEYALDRLYELSRLGHPLNFAWARRREPALASYLWSRTEGWDECLRKVGLDPDEKRKNQPAEHLEFEDIIRRFQERARQGQPLNEASVAREDLVLYNAARRKFYTYGAALIAAGFDPAKVRVKRENITDQEVRECLKAIRKLKNLFGPDRERAVKDIRTRFYSVVMARFGNWTKAAEAAGVNPDRIMIRLWLSRETIIQELKHLRRSGNSLTANWLFAHRRSLYHAILREFGSTKDALNQLHEQ